MRLAALLLAGMLAAAGPAFGQARGGPPQAGGAAEEAPRVRVYLIRGLFDVFSLGMDSLGGRLRRQGYQARTYGLSHAEAIGAEIAARRRADPSEQVVVIGHSLGANAAVTIANRIGRQGLPPLALVVAVDPTQRLVAEGGARRLINLYQSDNGWAVALRQGQSFAGRFANEDLAGRRGINHLNIDKSRELHERIMAWIAEAAAEAVVSRRPEPSRRRR